MSKIQIESACRCNLTKHPNSSYDSSDPKYDSDSLFLFYAQPPKPDSDFEGFIVGIHPTKGLLYIEANHRDVYSYNDVPAAKNEADRLMRVFDELTAAFGTPSHNEVQAVAANASAFQRFAESSGRDSRPWCACEVVGKDVAIWESNKVDQSKKIVLHQGANAEGYANESFLKLTAIYDGWEDFLAAEGRRKSGQHSIGN